MVSNDKITKARTLVEALPYIKQFSGTTMVVKYGGSLMVDDELKKVFANDITLMKYVGINPIIVHGGGKEISKWMQKMGKESVFIDGLRVTDSETMEITEMVLSGKINNEIVTLINQQGGKAIGMSGKSANLFTAEKLKADKGKDLGFVGTIKTVDTDLLNTLCAQGHIPVISSIGVSAEGESLNLNADNVASYIAQFLGTQKLIYITDVDGVMIDGELQSRFNLEQAKALMSHDQIKGGMLPKLDCSIKAVEGGVETVHIINGNVEHSVLLEVFTDGGIGSMIRETQ
ncbi:acetylglutamate kinase [bacterium]|jgi:acetylglutamate kinase|nr:acetylglutamate kinase [bacterium]